MKKLLNDRFAINEDKSFTPGGMADIYRAYDLESMRECAIKLFKTDFADDEVVREAFNREQKSLFDLNAHPNIVELLDYGIEEESGRSYIALEWVETTLKAHVRKNPVDGWEEFYTQYGQTILAALSFAYSRGILHRDVTPGNILLHADGTIKVADFGISKFKRQLSPSVTLADYRTYPYAPPETNQDYPDARDVFSFAVTALECISVSDFEVSDNARAFLEDELDCSDEVYMVFSKALSPDPAERPFSIEDLADQLKEAADQCSLVSAAGITIGIKIPVSVVNSYAALSHKEDHLAIRQAIVQDLNNGISIKQKSGHAINAEQAPERPTYNIIGTDFSYFAKRDDEDPRYLVLVSCISLDPDGFARLQRDAVHVHAKFALFTNIEATISEKGIENLLVLYSHERAKLRQLELKNERERLINLWSDTVDVRREIEKKDQNPIQYEALEAEGFRITLTPKNILTMDADMIGQHRLIKRGSEVYASGEVESASEDQITLLCDAAFDKDSLPAQGILIRDTARSQIALNRQDSALESLRSMTSARADLKKLLLDPTKATPPNECVVSFFQSNLDADKKQAVRSALGADDLLAVEGPPGTGKTMFIVETVLQFLKSGKTVLLSSQTHIALDNALEKIGVIAEEHGLDHKIVRIGRKDDSRVSDSTKCYLVEYGVSTWLEEVQTQSEAGLQEWASQHEVDLENVRIAQAFAHLKAQLERRRALEQVKLELDKMQASINSELDALNQGSTISLSAANLRSELEQVSRKLNENKVRLKDIDKEVDQAYGALNTFPDIRGEVLKLSEEELPEFEKLFLGDSPVALRCKKLVDLVEDWKLHLVGQQEFQSAYLATADVVAGTCVGIAPAHLSQLEFDVCIVDEASKALPTELLVPMVKARKWIIVGDTKQLPPYLGEFIRNRAICERFELNIDDLKETILGHLVITLPRENLKALTYQYRMAEPIGDLISTCFYESALKSQREFTETHLISSQAVPAPVTWYCTSKLPQHREIVARGSFINLSEISAISDLLHRLNSSAEKKNVAYTVAVMSGYTGQVKELLRSSTHLNTKLKSLEISFCTVDTYQGREADIAIYSVTRSNQDCRIGFLKERQRINVALSRGKHVLCIVGDSRFCNTIVGENPFSDVLSYISSNDSCQLVPLQ